MARLRLYRLARAAARALAAMALGVRLLVSLGRSRGNRDCGESSAPASGYGDKAIGWYPRAALAAAFGSMLVGCVLRMPPAVMASQQGIRVVSRSPESYVLRLQIYGPPRDYHVPGDGRVTLDIPGYRAACREYLFGKVRVKHGADPFTEKTVQIMEGGKTAGRLSLKDISRLPADPEGYHLLRVRAAQ